MHNKWVRTHDNFFQGGDDCSVRTQRRGATQTDSMGQNLHVRCVVDWSNSEAMLHCTVLSCTSITTNGPKVQAFDSVCAVAGPGVSAYDVGPNGRQISKLWGFPVSLQSILMRMMPMIMLMLGATMREQQRVTGQEGSTKALSSCFFFFSRVEGIRKK
jgi:hypothetical protein